MAAISSLVLSDNLAPKDRAEDLDTPTTPRPVRFAPTPKDESNISVTDHAVQPRPSAATFPLPPGQLTHAGPVDHRQDDAGGRRDSEEAISTTMDVDDDDNDPLDSDNDTEPGEADSASRKKKGQRFFCTGYPPCNLSFTRSEHLARHIRKHTGERPFQCHCNRRFSRLDNLRQHAQTVHVNEEIPTDSLAATGTRFQRQIRTDRVRPSGRPRTGTASSAGGHSRGHSRNLSASSVGSTSSNYSIVTEAKRRPPPLLMANDAATRPALGIDPPQTPPAQYRGYGANSPSGMSTPTSTQFSATPGSPGFLSSMTSPVSTSARLSGYLGSRPATRRLSVPSGPNPYQSQYPPGYSTTYPSQMGPPSSHASSNSSVFASPTSSTFPMAPGHNVPPGEDWRRRTWHPSTFPAANFNYGRPATSGLMYSQTPDAPQPAQAQHTAAGQANRLPGIESFDHVQHRSYTPPRRQPSPMQIDSSSASLSHDPRQGHISWDAPRHSHYPELDDSTDRNPPPGSWGQQTITEIQNVGMRLNDPHRHMDMGPPPPSVVNQQHLYPGRDMHDSPAKRSKRQAWYGGPTPPTRTSPEDSSSSDGVPTPGMTAVEVHPMIMPSSGYIEPQHAPLPSEAHQNVCLAPAPYLEPTRPQNTTSYVARNGSGGEMNRLEALVAVATSGENGAR